MDQEVEAFDLQWGERVRVRHAIFVPTSRDLFGQPIAAHWRYTVEYESGQWANDRRAEDLRELEHVSGAAVA